MEASHSGAAGFSDDINEERLNKLLDRFGDAIADDPKLTDGEIWLAAVSIFRTALFEIHCRGCREIAHEIITEMVTNGLRDTMVEAARQYADDPSSQFKNRDFAGQTFTSTRSR
jgi:hypothetical protein